MNTEQLRKYLDIRLDYIETQLNVLVNLELSMHREQHPAIMADLQKKLNDTRRIDFEQFLNERKRKGKRKTGKSRDEAYEEFFENYKSHKENQHG